MHSSVSLLPSSYRDRTAWWLVAPMSWSALFLVFFVFHVVGDFLLQTDWQARNKAGGLGSDPVSCRALVAHLAMYTLVFVPALIWIAAGIGPITAAVAGVAISLPHLVVDDGRLLGAHMRHVKRCPEPVPAGLLAAVDQSMHLVMLWVVAVVIGG
jgi:hypothetical protein